MATERLARFTYPMNFEPPVRVPTKAEVKAFADRVGATFPEEYISFITRHAGCAVSGLLGFPYSEHHPRVGYESWLNEIGVFLHYDLLPDNHYEGDETYCIHRVYAMYEFDFSAPHVVPFTTIEIGGDLAFDLSVSRIDPPIVKTNVYNGHTDDEHLILHPVAESFSDFCSRLVTEQEFEEKYGPADEYGTVYRKLD